MSSESQTSDSEYPRGIAELSGNDDRAFEEISSRGAMLQSELWKVLDVSSRTGSRIATRLAEEGVIQREETVADGNTTYKLVPATTSDLSTEEGDDANDESPVETESLDDRIVRMVQAQGELLEETVVRRLDAPVDVVYENIDRALNEGRIQQSVSEVYGRDRRQLVA